MFVDGHERPDVVAQRNEFLRKLLKIGFLHLHLPLKQQQPTDIEPPTADRRQKLVLFCHDESTFQSPHSRVTMTDDQNMQWGDKMMKPKSKGAGVMVSDFVDERTGFLAFTDEEYLQTKNTRT